jgi:hypothetical protein
MGNRALTILTLLVILAACSARAAGTEYFIYKERDGTVWFSDRELPEERFTYLGKRTFQWGRPPAYVDCDNVEARAKALNDTIRRYAHRHGLEPALVKAIIHVESCFDKKAVSRVGARGLMQLMPDTARELGVRDEEMFDPDKNIEAGVRYFRRMLERFKDLDKALAAYNAGPGAVRKYKGIPPFRETRKYVRRVRAQYERYRAAGPKG